MQYLKLHYFKYFYFTKSDGEYAESCDSSESEVEQDDRHVGFRWVSVDAALFVPVYEMACNQNSSSEFKWWWPGLR